MSIRKNFLYNFLLTGSNLLFPLITFPYLSRILNAEGIGVCNFIISYSQNFIIIGALGIPVYGVREIAKIGEDINKRSILFFELLTIHFIFTALLLIIYYSTVLTLPEFLEYKQLSIMGGMLILFNVFAVDWLFSGLSNFKFITIRSLIIRILGIASIFLFVKRKEDYDVYFIITIVTILLTVLTNIIYSRKFISPKVILTFRGAFKHIRVVVLLGIYMVLTSIYTILPITLLGLFSSKVAVGYYYTADKIVRMTISIFASLTTVMLPKLNLDVENEIYEDYLTTIQKLLNFVISIGIPVTFMVFLLSKPIIMLLAGPDFVNSILCLKILAFVIPIVAFAQIFVLLILSVHRKDREMVILSICGMIVSLMINLILIPRYAEKAATIAQFVSELIVTLIAMYFANRIIKIPFPVKKILLNIVFAIPFSVIIFLCMRLTDSNILIILCSSVACGLYYIFYQIFLIRDNFITELIKPYFKFFRSF